MNVLWFSWKDPQNPQAGGAELISGELMKNLVNDGHQVRLVTAGYKGGESYTKLGGIEVYRVGGRYSVYIKAFVLFRKQMKHWPELVIDEMNTLPFGCAFYTRRRSILLTYQLARKVWFQQMFFPLSLIGYIVEPFYLFLLSRVYKQVITESESTRADLARYGFAPKHTAVIRIGIALAPLAKLEPKPDLNTLLSLGALRPMKRTMDIVKGFEHAKSTNPALTLKIAGDASSAYGQKVTRYIKASAFADSIELLGKVDASSRLNLMREAALILVTSSKEGWGLIVTEANSQGTPAIAYDTDGLRDSIRNQETGILVPKGDYKALGQAANNLLADNDKYSRLRTAAWQWSKEFTFENSYQDFLSVIESKPLK